MEKNDSALLSKAFLNAGKLMGLTSSELSRVISCDISQLNTINPESDEGLRATYFIRSYEKLYGLLSGDKEEIKMWMKGYNSGTGGIPLQQIQEQDISGLTQVLKYLEAMP